MYKHLCNFSLNFVNYYLHFILLGIYSVYARVAQFCKAYMRIFLGTFLYIDYKEIIHFSHIDRYIGILSSIYVLNKKKC